MVKTASKPAGDDEKSSKVREAIFAATEQIMRQDGYPAVTSRRVGREAGLKSQLLHYYFKTMDDLFAALWQRYDDRFLVRQARTLASDRPLSALWELSTHTGDVTLRQEFVSMANHRKQIQALIAQSARRNRSIQVAGISQYYEDRGIADAELSPVVLVLMFAFVTRAMITEQNLGVSDDHDEIIAHLKSQIARIEALAEQGGRAAKSARR